MFLHSLPVCDETGWRWPRALIRPGRRSRSGRGRAGSRRAAEAMRDDARRRCGPGKGADPTGRRRTARSGPRGARRARRHGAHAAKPQPAEASRSGRSGKQAGRDAQRSKHRDPGLWSPMPGISASGMPSRMGSRAGGGDGGLVSYNLVDFASFFRECGKDPGVAIATPRRAPATTEAAWNRSRTSSSCSPSSSAFLHSPNSWIGH